MSSLFARVVKQSLITFARDNYSAFSSNLAILKTLVDQLQSNDLNIDPYLLSNNYFKSFSQKAPVTYLEIFEHRTFTMGVFILANKYTMPLHDHPGYGLLRVISGKAQIQSYSVDSETSKLDQYPIESPILSVIEELPAVISANTECSLLTPNKNNIHGITAIDDEPAAFFDIISPPYDSHDSVNGPKKCSFYRKIPIQQTTSNAENHRVYLQRINTPSHYYCDTAYYQPPDFLNDQNFLSLTDQTKTNL